jgi:hypothetical protein
MMHDAFPRSLQNKMLHIWAFLIFMELFDIFVTNIFIEIFAYLPTLLS